MSFEAKLDMILENLQVIEQLIDHFLPKGKLSAAEIAQYKKDGFISDEKWNRYLRAYGRVRGHPMSEFAPEQKPALERMEEYGSLDRWKKVFIKNVEHGIFNLSTVAEDLFLRRLDAVTTPDEMAQIEDEIKEQHAVNSEGE